MRTLFHPTREEISLTNVLYALSDPLRLSIVVQLARATKEMTCGDCFVGEGVAKSTLSHHFKVLREAGVMRTTSKGTRLLIALRREDLAARLPGLLEAVIYAYQTTMQREAVAG